MAQATASRRAQLSDAGEIARIYSEGIADRIATFETEPRSRADVERVLPERIGPGDLDAMLGDLNMLTGQGGRERTEAEFSSLLREGGFALQRVVPTSTYMSVLEAIPAS